MDGRFNPDTYTEIFDKIRKVFASIEYAKEHGLITDYFSFNPSKGKFEVCDGQR